MRLKHLWAAALARCLNPNDVTGSALHPTAKLAGGCRVDRSTVGRYTYMGAGGRLILCQVGAFCSLAGGVKIGGGAHAMDFVSTSPLFAQGNNLFGRNFSQHPFEPYRQTVVGNDVWIGADVHVKGGVTIASGAVIGMGSVVTKDVGPYEVWAGNPARLIRKRFDEETIERLLKAAWWDWPLERILQMAPLFDDPQALLREVGL